MPNDSSLIEHNPTTKTFLHFLIRSQQNCLLKYRLRIDAELPWISSCYQIANLSGNPLICIRSFHSNNFSVKTDVFGYGYRVIFLKQSKLEVAVVKTLTLYHYRLEHFIFFACLFVTAGIYPTDPSITSDGKHRATSIVQNYFRRSRY